MKTRFYIKDLDTTERMKADYFVVSVIQSCCVIKNAHSFPTKEKAENYIKTKLNFKDRYCVIEY